MQKIGVAFLTTDDADDGEEEVERAEQINKHSRMKYERDGENDKQTDRTKEATSRWRI